MKKMNMLWTKIAAIALGAILTVGVGATLSSFSPSREAEAATTETSRLWAKIVNKDQWDADGAATYIYYWGGSSSTSWFGVPINWDETNDMVYYDVPSDTTWVIFVRVNSTRDGVWNQTADLEATGHFNNWYFNLTGYGGGEWKNDITMKTTKVVSDFAATIDTAAEACSADAVNTAIDAYNALSTFEQDQFDSYSFGSPAKTGSETLNYLKSFYGISTPSNANVLGTSTDRNIAIIVTVGALSLTALAGFYFLSRKRKANQF